MAFQTNIACYDSFNTSSRTKNEDITLSATQIAETIAYTNLRPGDVLIGSSGRMWKIKSKPVKLLTHYALLVEYVVEAHLSETNPPRTNEVR